MRTLNKKIWPGCVRVNIDPKNHGGINKWLRENIGKWNNVYVISRGDWIRDYYFRSEELATIFALRWS